MTVVIDNSAALNGGPGVHAFIVGVSDYPALPDKPDDCLPRHHGMVKLDSAALAALQFYRWLRKAGREGRLPLPLATCRLLLSPSDLEIQRETTLRKLAARASLQNFLTAATEWRDSAAGHSENITFFYFAGHGVQRNRSNLVLLLEGFGTGVGGPLVHGVDLSALRDGMAPTRDRPNIAQTQYYFADACRTRPTHFREVAEVAPTQVFAPDNSGTDGRIAPIVFATAYGETAAGIRGKGSLFGEELISCLEGRAGDLHELASGEERWAVSLSRLINVMTTKARDQRDYEVQVAGTVGDPVICFLTKRPKAEVVFHIVPAEAASAVRISLRPEEVRARTRVLGPPVNPNPHVITIPAGNYRSTATIDPPDGVSRVVFPQSGLQRFLLPPRVEKTITVER
jgi:hypothetical protein